MQKVLARYVLCDLLRKQFNGNKAQMARQLDLSVRTVYRILNGEEVEHNGNDTSGKVLEILTKQYRELLVKTTTFSVD